MNEVRPSGLVVSAASRSPWQGIPEGEMPANGRAACDLRYEMVDVIANE